MTDASRRGESVSTTDTEGQQPRAADLAVAVLEAEAERERLQAEAHEPVLFQDDLLPGVGGEPMSLRDGLRAGVGFTPFVILMLLICVDELEAATLGVLAPDIRDSLHISNGTMVFLASASGAFLILGALPMGWMADRMRRSPAGPTVGAGRSERLRSLLPSWRSSPFVFPNPRAVSSRRRTCSARSSRTRSPRRSPSRPRSRACGRSGRSRARSSPLRLWGS